MIENKLVIKSCIILPVNLDFANLTQSNLFSRISLTNKLTIFFKMQVLNIGLQRYRRILPPNEWKSMRKIKRNDKFCKKINYKLTI